MSGQGSTDTDAPRDEGIHTAVVETPAQVYQGIRQGLSAYQTPVLVHAGNPHERLYVASFDGTGNDKLADPTHKTNVALISDQIEALKAAGQHRIRGDYVAGTGTQHNPFTRMFDGARGYTMDERAEYMYKQFIEQAKTWRREDPNVQIRVAEVGFSRGAEEAAMLTRMVEARGIQDASGAKYTYDSYGQIKHVEYTKPALVGSGAIAQAVVLFDPVATGQPMHEDRRLPPSVISGIQFIAKDERRVLFKSDHIIDPGITPDGRFAGVYVPGAHSDAGGAYLLNGLSIRTGNLAIDYLNGLSDQPFLKKGIEPDDPRMNVIHHSEEGMLLYQLGRKVNRPELGGYNELEVSRQAMGHAADPYNAEPRNWLLNAQLTWQFMPDGPVPGIPREKLDAPKSGLDAIIDRLYQGALHNDARAVDAAADDYLRTPHGQAWQQQAVQNDQAMQALQQATQYQNAQPQMAHPAPVMQH